MIAIDDLVKDILSRSTVRDSIVVLPEQLDRDGYLRVDKVLRAIGGKWNRKLKGHAFERGIPAEILAAVVESGKYMDKKKELGFFETPEWLAKHMIDLAAVRPDDAVLEPSAGRGALIKPLPLHQDVLAIEIDRGNTDVLIELGNSHTGLQIAQGDFLKIADRLSFKCDMVLMNPPFANGQDIDHVLAAWRCLKNPYGRLVAVMSAHFSFASDTKSVEFRKWLLSIHATVEELPEATFKESGTNVNTRLVFATKDTGL